MSRLVIFLCGMVFLSITSCERTSRDIAGRGQEDHEKIAMSSDVLHPSPHADFNIAGISEVLPRDSGDIVIDGQALFATHCSACHQISGQGIPGAFPPLVDSSYVTSDNVQRLASIMIYGLSGPITVKGVPYNSVMVGLGHAMSDAELAAVATYIRSSWGNKASPVSEEVFSAARKTHGSRSLFTIEELGADE